MTRKEWIEKVAPSAVYCQKKYGYPASALIGQTCQETGYGKTKLVDYNNVIGMKTTLLPYTSTTWHGKSVIKNTWEEVNGTKVTKDDSFRVYDSIQDCLEDYCQFMRDGKLTATTYKYRAILSWGDPEKVLRFITGKYATDSTYADKVLAIISKHNLTQYDDVKAASVHNISNCGHDENGQYSGGQAGDQTGTEWEIKAWYDRPWDVVLEPPSKLVSDTISELAIEAANNNLIGYDQGNRTSFDSMLIKYGNYPKNIKEACETDCSAGVAAIVRAVGRILGIKALQEVNKDAYTGNLEKALVAAGFSAHREARYRTSADYLGNGWILLYTGHHTAISVSTGAKWGEDTTMAHNTIKRGSTGAEVKTWQKGLLDLGCADCTHNVSNFVDGSFGSNTERYTRLFQKAFGLEVDGVVGNNSWAKMDALLAALNISKVNFTVEQLLAAAKARTKYYKAISYTWNSSTIAPWLDRSQKYTACDRSIDDYLNDVGLCVGNRNAVELKAYLLSIGGTLVTSVSEVKAGDVVFVNNMNHVFLCAGSNLRYDCGSTERIQLKAQYGHYSEQPFNEGISGFHSAVRLPFKASAKKQATTTSSKYKYSATFEQVSKGSVNKSVGLLQAVLKGLGYYKAEIDNSFGDDTYKAVVAFQAAQIAKGNNIGGSDGKPDGVCGKGTWSAVLGLDVTAL